MHDPTRLADQLRELGMDALPGFEVSEPCEWINECGEPAYGTLPHGLYGPLPTCFVHARFYARNPS